MDICIIEPCGGHKHMECIGFLLDIFKDLNVRVYYSNDKHDWIKYFKQLYKFDTENVNNIVRDLNEINNCKKVINLTADKFFPLFTKINNANTYDIHHLKHARNSIDNVIRLVKNREPHDVAVTGKYKENHHCYSIFEGNSKQYENEEKNIVMWCGWCKGGAFSEIYEKNFKDWNDKMKYKLQFFWTGGGRDSALKFLRKEIGEENVHRNIKSPYLPHFFKNVRFIMIRPLLVYGERLWSGGVTLALSHNIPIIIKESYRNVIEVPGITYKENYNEVYDKINNMSREEYQHEISRIKRFKLIIREKERKELL